MKNEILYDSDEAAQIKTVKGWVSGDGRFFGDNEHLARWNGCTLMMCRCGSTHEKDYTMCPECRQKARDARYDALPFAPWDGTTPLCLFDDDRYFFSEDDVLEFCEEEDIETADLKLVICEPQFAHQIEPDEEYCDILPEDQHIAEIAPSIAAAFEILNEAIKAYNKPISWVAGSTRTSLADRRESEAA